MARPCPLPSLPLTSIHYVPNFPFNLISISKLTRDLHCVLTFSHNSVTLQDRSTGKTIGIGHESQGLFHLSSPLCSTACISTAAPLLLHSRLGHPSLSKFQKLFPHFSSLSSLECESCQLGKHTRVLFPKRLDPRTKSLFELVHTNVWGPSRSAFPLGFHYFVTFIDDYSQCTWLFLMKTQAELFSIFQKFHAEIHTQFNTSIHILRSDYAKEYFSMSFSSFMSSHGILHQSSCAYTPQQNAVAERKNRHLVETTRTLPFHPLFCMMRSLILSYYLINLSFVSLLAPLVVCFVHILTSGQDKLSAKATKCVFLGYSRLQRDYRCYSPDINRYFISANVTFFEDSSFFSSAARPPIPDVLSIPLVLPSPDFLSPPTDVVTQPL